jgi:hypothetical protein
MTEKNASNYPTNKRLQWFLLNQRRLKQLRKDPSVQLPEWIAGSLVRWFYCIINQDSEIKAKEKSWIGAYEHYINPNADEFLCKLRDNQQSREQLFLQHFDSNKSSRMEGIMGDLNFADGQLWAWSRRAQKLSLGIISHSCSWLRDRKIVEQESTYNHKIEFFSASVHN